MNNDRKRIQPGKPDGQCGEYATAVQPVQATVPKPRPAEDGATVGRQRKDVAGTACTV